MFRIADSCRALAAASADGWRFVRLSTLDRYRFQSHYVIARFAYALSILFYYFVLHSVRRSSRSPCTTIFAWNSPIYSIMVRIVFGVRASIYLPGVANDITIVCLKSISFAEKKREKRTRLFATRSSSQRATDLVDFVYFEAMWQWVCRMLAAISIVVQG